MRRRTVTHFGLFFVVGIIFLAFAPSGRAAATRFIPIAISTPHPYQNNALLEWNIGGNDFEEIRIHFTKIQTEEGSDSVLITFNTNTTYITGNYRDYWTPWYPVSGVVLQFISDDWGTDYGFDMDGYEILGKPDWEGWGQIAFGFVAIIACLMVILYMLERRAPKARPRLVIIPPRPRRVPHPRKQSPLKSEQRAEDSLINGAKLSPQEHANKMLHVQDAKTFIREMKERPMYVEYCGATPCQRRRLKEKNPRLARLAQRVHRLEVWVLRNENVPS